MDWIARIIRRTTESRVRLLVSAIAGESLALAGLHHLWNVWGLPWDKPILTVLLAGPGIAVLISTALAPVWDEVSAIPRSRWLLFAVPAILIAAALERQFFVFPETLHELTIQPTTGDGAGIIQISEIRLAYGNSVPLSRFSGVEGWAERNGLLVAKSPSAGPLRYEFFGPVGEQARISFITLPSSGAASVNLDDQRLELNLTGEAGNETRARLTTRSRWGKLDPLFIPLVAGVDWLAFLSLLCAMWIALEIGQQQDVALDPRGADSLRFHRAGLIAVCSIALALHAVSFLAVPLRVTKDGPSYLQGAAHWATHGNFEGASSYRGPGTTFLLGPAMLIFGRNPWGVKLTLHALAFLCVPLAYRIAWQLQRRRWVAIAAGVTAGLSPDLYAYSNYVLSEVPDIFALLLFCTAMISALQRLSLPWMLVSMLAGSMAVLVRTDNIAALLVGFAALLVGARKSRPREISAATEAECMPHRTLPLAMAFVVAAGPLLAWSAHNARVHGFFGLSDYAGAVLYDGWIYFGESAGIKFIDRDSPAAREIDAVTPIISRGGVGPPTSWTVYLELVESGYRGPEAFALLGEAAGDSIVNDPAKSARILLLKLQQAARPDPTLAASGSSVGLSDRHADRTREFFDVEAGLVPSLGRLQDFLSDLAQAVYTPSAAVWLAYSLVLLWLSSYRQPGLTWVTLTVITLIVLLLPTVLGLVSWRYLLPGLSLLTPISLATSDTLGRFAAHWYSGARLLA